MLARTRQRLRALLTAPEGAAGAAAVEFGLIAPVFLLVVYGAIEFGRALFLQGVLFFAAEEATRFATVNYDATVEEIRDVAESKFIMVDPSRITDFTVDSDLNPTDQTKLVTVEISYAFEPLVPIGWGTIVLSGHSRGFLVDE